MRKVREVLRLHYATGMSLRAIARSLKVSPAVPAKAGMGRCIRRAEAQGLGWPLPDSLDDAGLERRLFPAPAPRGRPRPVPRWSEVHRELRAKGVTLALLWEESKAVHPEGLQYSWFCEQYRAWASQLDVVMRQEHRAGEKLFVDSAGHTVGVVDRRTGELRQALVFVAVLGASSYTCAEATWTQGLADRVGSHVRAFELFGGCPERVVPDNLRAAVSRAHPPRTRGPTRRGGRSGGGRPASPRVRGGRHQSDLPRPGPPLRGCSAPGAGAAASRQGQGGSGRSGGRALDTGCASSSHVLLAGRAQRGHRRAPSAAQRPRVAQAPGVAALAVRPARPPRASPAAHRALRVRRVEEGPGQHRLPRRGRRARLLRPPRLGPAPARRAPHRPHRGVPVPRSLPAQGPPHHRRRAHAREAPPDGPVDARALHPLGREDRTAHRHPHHHRARLPAPPPTGVALLPGDSASGEELRRGPPRSGRAPRAGHRQPQRPQRRVHPPIQALGGQASPIASTGPHPSRPNPPHSVSLRAPPCLRCSLPRW